jgi:hypothetical protein
MEAPYSFRKEDTNGEGGVERDSKSHFTTTYLPLR